MSASCFNIQIDNPTPMSGESSPQSKAQAITQPEEVILASLVFDKSSNKWQTKPCDESSNQPHVLIKPQLEHWAKLHHTPSYIPDKTRTKQKKSAGLADTGAAVVCAGTIIMFMRQMGLEEKHLCPTTTQGSKSRKTENDICSCSGCWPPKQAGTVHHKKLTRLFISRAGLLELGCLPQSWPYPQD